MKTTTQQIFEQLQATQQAGGAGGGTTYADLQRIDAAWQRMRTDPGTGPRPTFVKQSPSALAPPFDVIVCGGTLGIFFAAVLQQQGLSVAVVERGKLRGRAQDWNISRAELDALVRLDLLTADEAQMCISNEFNPVRVGFYAHPAPLEVWTRDVLNLGVSPSRLIDTVRHCLIKTASPLGMATKQPWKHFLSTHKPCVNRSVDGLQRLVAWSLNTPNFLE